MSAARSDPPRKVKILQPVKAAFSQTSVLGAHAPLRDSGMNSIRFTLATVEFDTNGAAVMATIAAVHNNSISRDLY
jgi:hypothetical protein